MPPKVSKRCSVCSTLAATKWYILDRRSLCDACHDIQLNPPLEPSQEQIPERLASGEHETTAIKEEEAASEREKATEGVVGTENKNEQDTAGAGSKDEEDSAAGAKSAATNDDALFKKPMLISPRRLRRRTLPVQCPVPVKRRRAPKKTGTSRRTLLLKKATKPTKTPRETATTKTHDKVLYENMWFHVGDIVSLIDTKDNTYYAQIRGLIIDSNREKSAVLTWLLPTTSSPPPNEGFHPATYLAGPDEDLPRCLSVMNFLMHASTTYFRDRNNPHPRPETFGPTNTTQRDNRNYVWSSIPPMEVDEN